MIFRPNCITRGVSVLVICPLVEGAAVTLETGTEPPTPAVAVAVPWVALIAPGIVKLE